jgi:hypothetical protein
MLHVVCTGTDCTERRGGLCHFYIPVNDIVLERHNTKCAIFCLMCKYIYRHTHTYVHIYIFRYVIYLENWGRLLTHIYHNSKRHNSSSLNLYCYNIQQILLCTVTAEKAAKHTATSNIKKWPHRQTFSASSRYCMNLWIRGTCLVHWKY